MFTLTFTILKYFDYLLLSWWWILLALVIDVYFRDSVSRAYLSGYEDGREEFEVDKYKTTDDWSDDN